jgi:hypothetical protein
MEGSFSENRTNYGHGTALRPEVPKFERRSGGQFFRAPEPKPKPVQRLAMPSGRQTPMQELATRIERALKGVIQERGIIIASVQPVAGRTVATVDIGLTRPLDRQIRQEVLATIGGLWNSIPHQDRRELAYQVTVNGAELSRAW